MTRGKGTRCLCILDKGEVIKVGGRAELIVLVIVAVVHENPFVAVDSFEDASPLYTLGGLLQRT